MLFAVSFGMFVSEGDSFGCGVKVGTIIASSGLALLVAGILVCFAGGLLGLIPSVFLLTRKK